MSTDRRHQPTRRSFLGYSGAGLGALAVADLLAACGVDLGTAEEALQIDVDQLVINDWITVRRPDDLLVLDVGLVNLRRDEDGGEVRLVKRKPRRPALLILALPSQHLSEQTTAQPPATLPAEHLRADGSRLVFNVGALVPIPLSIAGLLDACARSGLNVALGAAVSGGLVGIGTTSGSAGPRPLHPLETALELPTRLVLSPTDAVRFAHAGQPVASPRGRVELWHTRLDAPRDLRTMRALHHVAGPDLVSGSVPDEQARADIVTVSSDPNNPPIAVDRLSLSALGAWFDGALDNRSGNTSLLHWHQHIAMGRDVEVEVVRAGCLWPLPHFASLVTTVERRLTDGADPIAYLHRTVYCVRTQFERHYHERLPAFLVELERAWPFSSVRILTASTPPIDGAPPDTASVSPVVNGEPFRWQIEATDRRGEVVRFSMPLVWMPLGDDQPSHPQPVDPVLIGGQRLAFAPFVAGAADLGEREATTYETHVLELDAAPLDPQPGWDVRCYPQVKQAGIVVEALAATAGATAAVPVRFAQAYLTHGLDRPPGNKHDLVLELLAPIRADFVKTGTDKVGGFISPNLEVAGLSRISGPVTPAMVASPAADLTSAAVFPIPLGGALDAFCPRLFGCISLLDLLDDTVGLRPEDLVPKFVTQAFDQIQRLRQAIDVLLARKNELLVQLTGARTAIADTTADIYRHAQAIEAFFDVDHADYIIELADDARLALKRLVETADPATVTDTDVDDALALPLIEKVQKLGQALAAEPTARLIERCPGGGTLLRTLRRVLTGAADVAEVAARVRDVLRATLAALIKARDIARDKVVKLDWRPKLKSPQPGSIPGIDLALRPDGLLLSVELRAQQRGDQKAGADLLCSLEDFRLDLLSILRLRFKRLQFRQRMSQKPEIDVVFDGIEFIGKLAFVQTLQDILPTDGFSDPPAVKVDKNGLDASYSLDLPTVAVGVFSLEQMRIGARLLVPFLGDAIAFRFEFSRREAPFLVTVAMLGGGGFFELELTPKGMRSLVASIQFGAQLSASIGVASGSISFMGGFVYEMSPTGVALTGFLRIRGEVDVLGLISASIELYLALEYKGGKLTGTATLSIEISIGFFTLPVTLTTTRTFAGSNGDPPLADVVTESDFAEYCLAFAA